VHDLVVVDALGDLDDGLLAALQVLAQLRLAVGLFLEDEARK
jgi:hypothetical protein